MNQGKYATLDMRSRAVLAVAGGQPRSPVAEAYRGKRPTWLRWVRRCATAGRRGRQRRSGRGRPRLLAALDREALNAIVWEPASPFGFETDVGTVERRRQGIRAPYGRTVSPHPVRRRRRDAGFTSQQPERRYGAVNAEARQEWLRAAAPRVRVAVRHFRALWYFLDESKVSLTAFRGKPRAFRGQPPPVRVT